MNVELKDCGIIIDEAHNIMQAAEDVSSIEISTEQIDKIEKELEYLKGMVESGTERHLISNTSQVDQTLRIIQNFKHRVLDVKIGCDEEGFERKEHKYPSSSAAALQSL